jgi:acetyl esterase/lipase
MMNKCNHGKHYLIIVYMLIFFVPITSCSKSVQWTFQDISYGSDIKQTFNIIIPEGKNNVHAIVYLHGGFYYSGNKLWYPLFLTEYSENNIFVTMDYRLIDFQENNIHMEDMLFDVYNALMKIQLISNENGVNINDFILAGHSAGAHLALLYGYKYFQENEKKNINIAACISLSGPSDYTDDFGWSSMSYYGGDLQKRLSTISLIGTKLTGYDIELTQYNWTQQKNYAEFKECTEDISPIMYVYKKDKLPPTLLVHGLDDRIVPYSNSIKLNAALDNTNVPHKLITVIGTGNNHMLGGRSNRTDSVKPIKYKNQAWINETKDWLEVYLR